MTRRVFYLFTFLVFMFCSSAQQMTQSTAEIGSVKDIDDNIYKTIKIGNQWWMAENLKTDHYSNGDPIPNVQDEDEWGNKESGSWCHYDNESKYEEPYGKLYNWYAVNDPRKLAPEGWHIPSDNEWNELELFLGMNRAALRDKGWRGKDDGDKLKETGILHWKAPNEGATNETGFTALPGGYRDVNGTFYVKGYSAYWWSSTEYIEYFAWYRSLYHTHHELHRTNGYIGDGYSVRCLKDL